MVWFGLVLIYDKPVWFGSKFSVNGLVSPIFYTVWFKWFGSKRFGLNGFINFKQVGSVFIINKWFGLVCYSFVAYSIVLFRLYMWYAIVFDPINGF